MHRTYVVLCIALAVFMTSFGVAAAGNDTVQQLIAPNGMSLLIRPADTPAHIDGLRLVTADTAADVVWPEGEFAVMIVVDGKVQSIRQGLTEPPNDDLPTAENTQMLIGNIVGISMLNRFKAGDNVSWQQVPNNLPQPTPVLVITQDGATKELHGINKSRGGGELVVYTPEFGSHTQTNQFGFEAIVIDGKVAAHRQYGDTTTTVIPKNGFVVSGQGANGTWVKENLPLGMQVDLY